MYWPRARLSWSHLYISCQWRTRPVFLGNTLDYLFSTSAHGMIALCRCNCCSLCGSKTFFPPFFLSAAWRRIYHIGCFHYPGYMIYSFMMSKPEIRAFIWRKGSITSPLSTVCLLRVYGDICLLWIDCVVVMCAVPDIRNTVTIVMSCWQSGNEGRYQMGDIQIFHN